MLLLEIAQLPRATFYYHVKKMHRADKYADAKTEIAAIYHENKGRYGYRRITMVLRSRGFLLNHKTVQRLRAENEYLKNLQALVLEEERRQRKKRR